MAQCLMSQGRRPNVRTRRQRGRVSRYCVSHDESCAEKRLVRSPHLGPAAFPAGSRTTRSTASSIPPAPACTHSPGLHRVGVGHRRLGSLIPVAGLVIFVSPGWGFAPRCRSPACRARVDASEAEPHGESSRLRALALCGIRMPSRDAMFSGDRSEDFEDVGGLFDDGVRGPSSDEFVRPLRAACRIGRSGTGPRPTSSRGACVRRLE